MIGFNTAWMKGINFLYNIKLTRRYRARLNHNNIINTFSYIIVGVTNYKVDNIMIF